jgi:hypothetical protein
MCGIRSAAGRVPRLYGGCRGCRTSLGQVGAFGLAPDQYGQYGPPPGQQYGPPPGQHD